MTASSFLLRRLSRTAQLGALTVATLCGSALVACKSSDVSDKPARQTPEAPAKPAAKEAAEAPPATAPPKTGQIKPEGPRLVVQPGKGISAMFFGATRETLERHMGAPCDHATESRCVYVARAVDFSLEEGAMKRAKVYIRDTPVPGHEGELFGSFKGLLLPSVMLGLHQHIVLEEYGEPKKKEDVALDGKTGLVARHFYDGVTLEYSKISNGNTVLSAIEVFPSMTAKDVAVPVPN